VSDSSASGLAAPVRPDKVVARVESSPPVTRALPAWITSQPVRLLALVAIYLVVAHVWPRPESVTPGGWRVTALFLATIAGLMIQPLPGAALVIISLTLFVLIGELPITRVLGGYASPSVWLVLTAMLMSRTLRDTGLSRRIALVFVGLFGRTSLGVSYSLVMSDVTLAAGIPSITARSGGIVLPIARSIAELYDSTPGPTAARLGTFLMTTLYQGSAVACAMFMTGQASNVLVAGLAGKLAGVEVTWSSWFVAALVPGLVSCAVIPFVISRMLPPGIRQTPAAAAFARRELRNLGRLSRHEGVALAVFVGVCAMWMTSGWHRLDVAVVAMAAIGILFVTNVLTWETALREQSAWDVFVWYGGLLTMGEVLNETGSTTVFANWVGGSFTGMHWYGVLLATLVVYFYAHYAFASITAHALAMFPPFVVMLIGLGTPPLLAVYSLACMANLTAGLTHYGTTTAPIVFAERYVTFADWWRVGFAASLVNLTIWLTVGFAWWKFLGFW
jgi:DASS family divalent anion:Na+ symporter